MTAYRSFNYLIRFLIAGVLCSVTLHAQTHYFNPRTQVNLTIPNIWTRSTHPNPRYFSLKHSDIVATVNISTHYFSNPVTINGFQIMKKTSAYDGWENIGEKEGSQYEALLANVSENYKAIYRKRILDEQLKVQKLIVAEYYYLLNPKRGYIFSVMTYQRDWKSIQHSVKQLLNSFWIGAGDRPQAYKPDAEGPDWEMVGKNASNQHYVDMFSAPVSTNVSWQFDLPLAITNATTLQPVISNRSLFFHSNNFLYSLDRKTGQINWRFKLSASVSKHLIYKDNALYLIKDGKVPTLISLQADTGTLLYKQPLESAHYSDPIISAGHLFIVDNHKLKSFIAKTGKLRWQIDQSFDSSFHPVVAGNMLFVLDTDHTLYSFFPQTGTPVWTMPQASALLFPPSIYKNNIIICRAPDTNNAHESPIIEALHLKTGALVWSYPINLVSSTLVSGPSVGKDTVVIPIKIPTGFLSFSSHGDDLLICLDINTGELLWSKSELGTYQRRPITTKDMVLVQRENSDSQTHILGFDHQTGDLKYTYAPGNELASTLTQFDFTVHSNNLFLLSKDAISTLFCLE